MNGSNNACRVCVTTATRSWQRNATAPELAEAKTGPSVAADETSCLITVLACDEHALEPDLAARVHDPDCSAPPACDCSAAAANDDTEANT